MDREAALLRLKDRHRYRPSISKAWKWHSIISEDDKIKKYIFRAVYLLRTARKTKRVLVVLTRCYIASLHLEEWFIALAHKGTHHDVIMRSMDEENSSFSI